MTGDDILTAAAFVVAAVGLGACVSYLRAVDRIIEQDRKYIEHLKRQRAAEEPSDEEHGTWDT